MKNVILLIALFCLTFSVTAGNNDKGRVSLKTVAGKVTDASGEALPGARITVKETGEVFFANLEGNFSFSLKNDQVYNLSVETIGFLPKELKSSELSYFSELSLSEL